MILKKVLKNKINFLVVFNLFFLIIVLGFNIGFQYNFVKSLKVKVNKNYKTIVGKLVSEYPDKEIDIVKPILNIEDEKFMLAGEKILKKYGYDNTLKNFLDVSFNKEIKQIIIGNIFCFVFVLVAIFSLYILAREHIKKYFKVIDEFLNSFLKKDFSYSKNIIAEGDFGDIINNFNRLGRLLELEIEKLEREKESSKEAITDLGHQIKTPLAALSLYNSILEDSDLNIEERHEFLNENKKAILKITDLFKSLINIAKLEKEMIRIKPEYLNMKNTIIEAVNAVYLKAESKNILINLENIYDYEIIHDKKWTEEAIINILDNAIKYNKVNGSINIVFEEGINYFKIHILDTGIGIKKFEYNKVFKRFYRGNDRQIEEIEGSGVGLYLAKKIIELQGGNILVTSKINEGSKFSLFLQNCKSE
ncbi:MAG: sensor histidine kinase [Sarcina sp.]